MSHDRTMQQQQEPGKAQSPEAANAAAAAVGPNSNSSAQMLEQQLLQMQQQQQLGIAAASSGGADLLNFHPRGLRGVLLNGNPTLNSSNMFTNGSSVTADRRGSLASVDDLFGGRRASIGYDMGMDAIFGRRDSMDSSAAALDTAILDFKRRRRYSLAPTGPLEVVGSSSGLNLPPFNPTSTMAVSNSATMPHYNAAISGLPANLAGMSNIGVYGGGLPFPPHNLASLGTHAGASFSNYGPIFGAIGSAGGHQLSTAMNSTGATTIDAYSPSNASSVVSSLAARQQQLQQQQRELEERQRELEIQRERLLSSMHDRKYLMSLQQQQLSSMAGLTPSSMAAPLPVVMANNAQHSQYNSLSSFNGSNSLRDNLFRGSLGLGNVAGIQSCLGLGPFSAAISSDTVTGTSSGIPSIGQRENSELGASRAAALSSLDESHHSNTSSATKSQWWVCQICNTKAFLSKEEFMAHEHDCRSSAKNNGSAKIRAQHQIQTNSTPLTQDVPTPRDLSLCEQSSSLSKGPFANMEKPIPLAMPSDKDWLTPLHCFVRLYCVEVFTASKEDVATPSKGKRKPITVGQVGIRCPHCHKEGSDVVMSKGRERGSVYYPTSIPSIYNATMNLLQRHLHSCTAVPDDIMRRYENLKADDARSGTSKRYWKESALSLGLVDTDMGIRYSEESRPPLPPLTSPQQEEGQNSIRCNSNEFFSTKSNANLELNFHLKNQQEQDQVERDQSGSTAKNTTVDNFYNGEQGITQSGSLVTPDDKPYSTEFSYNLLSQMQPCVFTEADRLGKRKGLPQGFPGLACRHCFGGYGSGRFFPSSIKTLSDTSKTLNVLHNHMMRCRKCPSEVRETLERLRGSHDEERAKMKFGSQKAFFGRIWDRLHGKNAQHSVGLKREGYTLPSSLVVTNDGAINDSTKVSGHGQFQSPHPSAEASIIDDMRNSLGHESDPKRQKTH